jgi:FeS assembly SUF system protein
MAITVTEAAAAEIRKIITDQGMSDQAVLRVGIKGRNIQGFNYSLDLTEVRHDDDVIFESHGITIVCDPVSLPSLQGTEINYRDDTAGRGFVFKNPNSVPLPVNSAPPTPGVRPPTDAADGGPAKPPEIISAIEDSVMEADIIEKLRTIYDPEIPVNIYDLGLIYRVEISPEKDVTVDMTLTAPGCPVAGTMPPQVQQAVASVEGIKSAKVNLVWEPAWTKDRMSEAAKLQLGMF